MKYIIDIPDEVPVSDELVPFDMCRPSWYLEAYEKGKADAEDEVWDFVSRLIWSFVDREILGMDIALAVRDMTYQEAKAKYEAWKKQKDEIRVGDEVKTGDSTGIVYMVADEKIYGVCNDVPYFMPFEWYISLSHKTGMHFDGVEELLKKMREEK